MVYSENDFVFKNEDLDSVLAFIKEYKKEDIPGLRNESNKLFDLSKKSGKAEYSSKSGLSFYYDKNNDEYNVIIKNEYDPSNLLSVLFDYVIEPTELSSGEEIAQKYKLIDLYLNKIMKEEKIELQDEVAKLKKLVKDQVVMLENYNIDDLDEEACENIADIIDKEYYEPISDIFEDLIAMFASKQIKIDEVKESEI